MRALSLNSIIIIFGRPDERPNKVSEVSKYENHNKSYHASNAARAE